MVQRLAQTLSDKFGLPVAIRPNFIDLSAAHRPSRRQYDYSVLLAAVHRRVRGTRGRVVLLTAKDTFGGDLNWSTGIAYCSGLSAVVSVCRLNPTFWGESADQKKWEERVRKILLHELGHTFGRTGHCSHWNCCLHGSNSIADIDRTGRDYCPACARLARTAVAGIKGE
jgi:archaemetzincin